MFNSKTSDPKADQLRRNQQKVARVQEKLRKAVQHGQKARNDAEQQDAVRQARELVHQLATLTWDGLALQMELAQELPTWTAPTYYYAPGLEQWAKVRALSSGRFIFEAVGEDAQGVLAEVATFEFLAPWQTSTAQQYHARLQLLLEDGGVQWNTLPFFVQ